MRFIDVLKSAFLSLRRNKVRTFLTSFAIFIGVFIIIFLVSLSFGAQKILLGQITNQFDLKSIFVFPGGTLDFSFFGPTATEETEEEKVIINEEALTSIRNFEKVEAAKPVVQLNSKKLEFLDKSFDERVVNSSTGGGFDLEVGDGIVTEILAGRIDNLTRDEAVVVSSLVEAYDKTPEELLGQKILLVDQPGLFGSQAKPLEDRTYTIVGVIPEVRNFTYIVNLEEGLDQISRKNAYETAADYIETVGYQSLYVQAQDESSVEEVSNEIKALGFDTSTLEEVLAVFNSLFNLIPIIFTIVGSIAIFVAAIGIINTMVMSVYERTKEIGVMKAVGAKNTTVLSLFITESGLIGFLGGSLAALGSLLVIFIANSVLVNKVLPELGLKDVDTFFITPFWLIAATVLGSTLIGILAGLYPAYRASRLDPVKALRYE